MKRKNIIFIVFVLTIVYVIYSIIMINLNKSRKYYFDGYEAKTIYIQAISFGTDNFNIFSIENVDPDGFKEKDDNFMNFYKNGLRNFLIGLDYNESIVRGEQDEEELFISIENLVNSNMKYRYDKAKNNEYLDTIYIYNFDQKFGYIFQMESEYVLLE